ncbi:hypothetical protein D3C86_2038920 [compost metagenome]
MRVDLGFVADARGADAEALDRPVEIGFSVGLPEGKPLAQRRFVDLDHRDTGRFQVVYLVAQRQRDLPAHDRSGQIVAHEGPLQHRHRPGEHALHRP